MSNTSSITTSFFICGTESHPQNASLFGSCDVASFITFGSTVDDDQREKWTVRGMSMAEDLEDKVRVDILCAPGGLTKEQIVESAGKHASGVAAKTRCEFGGVRSFDSHQAMIDQAQEHNQILVIKNDASDQYLRFSQGGLR